MCLHVYILTYKPLSVSRLLYSHMHALVFIYRFLHLWLDVCICVIILISMCMCVCVWVCISLSVWELMSSDDSLGECICVSTCRCLRHRVHLRTLCTGIFPICSAMSLFLLVYVCLCGTYAHFCLHAYIWQYTHVSVQLCVCEGVLGSASVGAYLSMSVCTDMYACVPLCLCVFSSIFVGLCVFKWNVFMCVNLYRCIFTSFGVNTFVHLHGCESMYFSVSVYMPVSLWIWDSVHECDFVCSSCASKWVCVSADIFAHVYLCVGL